MNKATFPIAYWAFLVLVVLFLYSPTFHAPFFYDDNTFIVNNPFLRDPISIKSVYLSTLGQPTRPVTFLTFMLNYHAHQLDVFGYHIVNVGIHLIVTWFVYVLTTLILSTTALQEDRIAPYKHLIALLTACVFAVHPVQTQAVSYITQRMASLATLFYIGSLCCYVKARLTEGRRTVRALWYAGVVVTGAIGILTKEIVFTLPLMIVFVEYFLLQKQTALHSAVNDYRQLSFGRKAFGGVCIAGVTAVFYAFFSSGRFAHIIDRLLEPVISRSHDGDVFSLGTYLLTQLRVVMTFFRLFFIPVYQSLDYDFPMSTGLFAPPTTFISLIVIIILLCFAWWARKKYKVVSFGLLFFFLTISINLIPRPHIISEHKLYLTSIGLCLATMVGLFYAIKNIKNFKIVAGFIIVVLACVTYQRNFIWQDGERLWQDVIKKFPKKERGYLNLADIYIARNSPQEAIKIYTRWLDIEPASPETYNSRGLQHQEVGQYGLALDDYNKTLAIDPLHKEALINKGNALWRMGLIKEAVETYEIALTIKRNNTYLLNNLGSLYLELGNQALALQYFNQAIEYDRYFAEAYINRGNLYFKHKLWEKALADYNKALALKLDHPKALYNRVMVFMQEEKYEEALMDMNQLIRGNPSSIKYLEKRAEIYRKLKQFDKALAEFNYIARLDPGRDIVYLSRAHVYSQMGQWDSALQDLNDILARYPGEAFAYYLRSVVHFSLGDPSKALQDLEQAMALGYPIPAGYLEQLKGQVQK